MSTFVYTPGSRFPIRAPVAAVELERIRVAHGGVLRPGEVVAESAPADAPLHPCFEWDDQQAAQLYREDQARQVIRSVRVLPEGEPGSPALPPVVAYVHVETEAEGACYMTTARVMADDVLRAQALREALSLLEGVRRRYDHLQGLQAVFRALDEAHAAADGRAAGTKGRPARRRKSGAA